MTARLALCLSMAPMVLALVASGELRAEAGRLELMLPGDDYHAADLPPRPAGLWWVLHRPAGTPTLERLQVVVTSAPGCGDETPDEPSGRTVTIPRAREPMLLVRGSGRWAAGPVPTAFVDRDGTGDRAQVRASWRDQSLIVKHTTVPPSGDQLGQYRVELKMGTRRYSLQTGPWHGDGHWSVRWIGDLNRDGWPDLLFDASYKYSLHTTRLFLSLAAGQAIEYTQAAQFERSAC